jgi:hypothetical protein
LSEDHIGNRDAAQTGDTPRRILDGVREESAAERLAGAAQVIGSITIFL